MALRNRNDQETNKLYGVNLAIDETKLGLGWFERLENWAPGDILSLKKKRGVRLLDATTATLESGGPFTADCT